MAYIYRYLVVFNVFNLVAALSNIVFILTDDQDLLLGGLVNT